nr:hypothetical protein [Luteirhabdus pelagi]
MVIVTKEEFTYLLANPQNLKGDSLTQLGAVITQYPYLQSARALELKGLKDSQSYRYNDALKVTAAYTTDRNILFEYITSEHFTQHEISQRIYALDDDLYNIEVEVEDVSAQTAMELDKQIREERKKADAILNPALFERKETVVDEGEEDFPEEQTSAEEALGINKPLDFKKEDTHSFSEWLKLTSAKPIEREDEQPTINTSEEIEEEDKSRNDELIDKFLQEQPKINPQQQPSKKKNLAKPFTQPPEALMTETLAKVYLQQKNYKKAIQAYKILILKNPEKSGFFADQIRAIEKIIDSD